MESLTVPGKLEFLKAIRQYVLASASEFGLDERRAYRLSLAVDEIATNIITYGYGKSDSTGTIEIQAIETDNGLEIVLEDSTPPFDPHSKDQPKDLAAPSEARDIGGLGIFLARENVDEFRYEYVNGRNRNVFVVNNKVP
jgi:anti-sigma regulatory factor (Ser/Thr protein kinase)